MGWCWVGVWGKERRDESEFDAEQNNNLILNRSYALILN